jgi:hypothetical protein
MIICQLIVHLLVIVQDNKRYTVHVLKFYTKMQFPVGGSPFVPQHLRLVSLTLDMTRGMSVSEVTNYRLADRSSVPGKANNLPPLHCF